MFLKEFFYFQRSDRRAIQFILILIAISTVAFWALSDYDCSNDTNEAPTAPNAAGTTAAHTNTNGSYISDDTERTVETFVFDPNTADSTQLRRLGLQPWQIRNIYKYRSKGGVYRSKEDFAYVYGLTVKEYRRLAPYIRIGDDYRPASSLPEIQRHRTETYGKYTDEATRQALAEHSKDATPYAARKYTPKIRQGEHVFINSADTAELMKIPGIGSYYSRAIVRYRSQLGGFVSKRQLLEIENFPEEALEYIAIDNSGIKKLNVNRMTVSQMRRHPYINYYQARAIADYRRLHGSIRDIRELRMMPEFSDNDFKRIEPYVEY